MFIDNVFIFGETNIFQKHDVIKSYVQHEISGDAVELYLTFNMHLKSNIDWILNRFFCEFKF
jgi:hypothetical protein